jgi:hypothetical protein
MSGLCPASLPADVPTPSKEKHMGAVPFQKTGTAPEDTPWSWDAATQNKILGESGDDWAKYKAAHAWVDTSDGSTPEKKSPYKLPHHRMGDNGLEAVWRGVANAMARLEQTDLPDADVAAVHSHLSKHYAQWDKDAPDLERIMAQVRANRARTAALAALTRDDPLPNGATRAQISVTAARPGGFPTDDDLPLINAMARSPLSKEQVYVFPVEMSSQVVDAYFTRMTPKTLQTFADRANAGIAVCDSHEHRQLPIGRSYYGDTATVVRDGEQVMTSRAMDYMLRGVRTPNGMMTDDIIHGIEGGVNNDVSVGFIPQAYWCSICGANMLRDYNCYHMPGMIYEVKKEGERDAQDQTCIADVDADLSEHSLVYDGATPNAMVLKAEREMEAGRATLRLLTFVEDRCRVKLYERWRGYQAGYQATASGLAVPARPASSAKPAAALPAPRVADAASATEEDAVSGTDTVDQFRTRLVESLGRSGKKLSAANEMALRNIRDQLQTGTNTHSDAIGLLGDFLAENGSMSTSDDDPGEGQGGSNEGGYSAPAKSAGSQVRAKSGKKAPKEEPDGTSPPPDGEQEGDGESDDEAEAEKHDGEGEHGEDKEDAKSKKAAPSPNKPGTDDGDGDDDTPTEGEKADEDDSEQGSPKSSKKKGSATKSRTAAETAAAVETERGTALLPAEAQEALDYYRRAKSEAVEAALRCAARALGEGFTPASSATYRTMLERASLEEVGRFRDDWQALAKQQLSPRGRPTLDQQARGGVRWSEEPTGEGGRQTQPRDPGDPVGMIPAGARVKGGSVTGPSSAQQDPSLYTAGRRSGRR